MLPALRVSRMPDGRPEIFTSIQGEGASAGMPSVFLRLALCNLRCAWCDTKYTWDWRNYDYSDQVMTLEAAELADAIRSQPARNLVLTGGEPLLQQEAAGALLAALRAEGFRVEVETNGTILPRPEFAAQVDQWNVSPKLSNSSDSERLRLRKQPLSWFAATGNAWFKFVVAAADDLAEVEQVVVRFRIERSRVFLMPEARTPEDVRRRAEWLVPGAIEHGYRVSPRLHVLLWGDERGR
jgi:7-cyano-7-deazaguanosine (preQ0) biosynthesis protein QueE